MDKDFYTRKMNARFHTFDYDGDGVVTEADFGAMANHVLEGFSLSAGSPEGQNVLRGAAHLWTSLCDAADSDHDGQITPQEFTRGAERSMFGNRMGFASAAEPWAWSVVEAADTDGDGRIDAMEYGRMLRALGAKEPAIRGIVPLMVGQEGWVPADAVQHSALQFYTSDEPYHPANWTFGRF